MASTDTQSDKVVSLYDSPSAKARIRSGGGSGGGSLESRVERLETELFGLSSKIDVMMADIVLIKKRTSRANSFVTYKVLTAWFGAFGVGLAGAYWVLTEMYAKNVATEVVKADVPKIASEAARMIIKEDVPMIARDIFRDDYKEINQKLDQLITESASRKQR